MSAGASGVVATDEQIRSLLDQSITRDFNGLDQGGKIIAEYVWIGGSGQDLRSKARCAPSAVGLVPDPDLRLRPMALGGIA